MNKLIGLFAILVCSLFSYGQAYEGAVQYEKALQPAAVIELPYPPSVVTDAMNDYLSKKGKSKSNDVKGFSTFRNTQAVDGDSINADLYFKMERKSRKEKDVTLVSLLLKPTDAQSATRNLHYMDMKDAKTYLNELAVVLEGYNLEAIIKAQNEAIIKAEAKYKNLTQEGEDLLSKKSAIEKKIADNKNDQQQQLKEIGVQKEKLSQSVSARKS